MATTNQIKRIHSLKSRLKLDDITYRCILSQWSVQSSKELSYEQARELLAHLEKQAVSAGVWKPKPKKYDDLLGREEHMAPPSKLRLIEALWAQVSWCAWGDARDDALQKMCKRITGKNWLSAISDKEANKLIKAIKSMKAQKERLKNQHKEETRHESANQ